MQRVASFRSSAVSRDELNQILGDYLALDRARVVRRQLVTRLGLLALLALAVDFAVPNLSLFARWLPLALLAVPMLWAWVVELRVEHRLTQKLDDVGGVSTHAVATDANAPVIRRIRKS